jgi:precorrin-8X/cobalt-precorrin-8 methylmutase
MTDHDDTASSELVRPSRRYEYEDDGQEIYRRSFDTIREEARLDHLPEDARVVAVRMVHASGDVALTEHIAVHPELVGAARTALAHGAPIFTDAHMIAAGITRARLPRDNEVVCTLRDERVPVLAERWGTTRSAAAVSLWGDRLDGAVVAIGNAPTALFHLLELVADGGARPAAVIGIPVGFIGSAESKVALVQNPFGIPWLVVHGRRGGSALAASAVNALAREEEL